MKLTDKMSGEELIKQMDLTREYAAMFNALRKKLNIPVRQPLLDYSYGAEYIFPGFLEILAKEINIYNLGYSFSDKDFYSLFEFDPPEEKGWEVLKKDNKWVALYVNLPDWLKEVGEKRKKEREEIIKKIRQEK